MDFAWKGKLEIVYWEYSFRYMARDSEKNFVKKFPAPLMVRGTQRMQPTKFPLNNFCQLEWKMSYTFPEINQLFKSG